MKIVVNVFDNRIVICGSGSLRKYILTQQGFSQWVTDMSEKMKVTISDIADSLLSPTSSIL